MPIKIADLQTQFSEAGRLRLGMKGPEGKGIVKSNTFILTSHDRNVLTVASSKYGGELEESPCTKDPWRVITKVNQIPALITPVKETRSYEMYQGGNCIRRCDGETEEKSGKPCMCPADTAQWLALSKTGKACSFKLKLSVWLPELPGIGIWLFVTKSFYAGMEIPKMAGLLREAAKRNQYLPVNLAIEERRQPGKKFFVLVIRMPYSVNDMMQLTSSASQSAMPRLLTTEMLQRGTGLGLPMLEAPVTNTSDALYAAGDVYSEDEEGDEDDTLDGEFSDDHERAPLQAVGTQSSQSAFTPNEAAEELLAQDHEMKQCPTCSELALILTVNGNRQSYDADGERHPKTCKKSPSGWEQYMHAREIAQREAAEAAGQGAMSL